MRRFFRALLERWRAWRRGDVRIAPAHATRGRLYGKREAGGGGVVARTEPEATISARVYRAATGQWEDRGVIAPSAQVHRKDG